MWNDIRYAFRVLKKSPGFAFIAILTLAMGIGLTTALFTVINGVLLRPLQFKEPDRLLMLWEKSAQDRDLSVAYPNYLDWRSLNSSFESLAAFRLDDFNLTGRGEAERVRGRMISANFLSTLGIQPALGRGFRPDEDRVSASPVAMLSYRLWKNTFAGDPKILGQIVQANDKAFTIVGVMPENYHLLTEVDFFVPIGQFAKNWPSRDNHPGIYVVGRLRENASLQSARIDMNQIAQRLDKQFPATNAGKGIHIVELAHNITGEVRPALWLLFGAVVFVLLIGCANIANMLLARGMARQKEIAIRMALGASRGQLIRQFLTESVLLSLTGGLLGLLLARNVTDLLLWLRPANLPRLDEIHIDWVVLAFTFGASVLSGMFFGLLPALQSSHAPLQEAIKEAGTSMPAFGSRHRLRHALVIAQVAFSLLLLIGAGLMTKSILLVMKSSPGFQSARLLTVSLSLSTKRYQGQQVLQYIKEAQQRIEKIPGVESVAYANGLPFAGANEGIFWIAGRPKPRPGEELPVVQYLVSPNYARTLEIPLLRGNFLSPLEDSKQPWKVVIDEALAKQHFPNEDPLGKSIRLEDSLPPFAIVGIAGHVKHYGLDVTAPINEEAYFSILQIPDQLLSMVAQELHFVVKTSVNPMTIAPSVRRALKDLDPLQPVSAPRTMDALISESLAARKFSVILLSIFAAVALFLAAAGIYGVLSYMVAQRSKEIGIRIAVGAGKSDVLKLILSGGFRLILAGIVAGIVAALTVSKIIASQLYAVSPTDPSTFIMISVFLSLVGMGATFVPALRAMKVDPISILKYE